MDKSITSSKSFSSKATCSCRAPRLLVLLIVRSNLRLLFSGFRTLVADKFACRGCFPLDEWVLTALPSMVAVTKERGDLKATFGEGKHRMSLDIGIQGRRRSRCFGMVELGGQLGWRVKVDTDASGVAISLPRRSWQRISFPRILCSNRIRAPLHVTISLQSALQGYPKFNFNFCRLKTLVSWTVQKTS